MNVLTFESYLLNHVSDDVLRNSILAVLTTMEEQVNQGAVEPLLCVLARQDPQTELPLDVPLQLLAFVELQALCKDPKTVFAGMRRYAARSAAQFAIFATPALMPRPGTSGREDPFVILFVQHETMVEDHWYVAARVKLYESSAELIDLQCIKQNETDKHSPAAGLQLVDRTASLN